MRDFALHSAIEPIVFLTQDTGAPAGAPAPAPTPPAPPAPAPTPPPEPTPPAPEVDFKAIADDISDIMGNVEPPPEPTPEPTPPATPAPSPDVVQPSTTAPTPPPEPTPPAPAPTPGQKPPAVLMAEAEAEYGTADNDYRAAKRDRETAAKAVRESAAKGLDAITNEQMAAVFEAEERMSIADEKRQTARGKAAQAQQQQQNAYAAARQTYREQWAKSHAALGRTPAEVLTKADAIMDRCMQHARAAHPASSVEYQMGVAQAYFDSAIGAAMKKTPQPPPPRPTIVRPITPGGAAVPATQPPAPAPADSRDYQARVAAGEFDLSDALTAMRGPQDES